MELWMRSKQVARELQKEQPKLYISFTSVWNKLGDHYITVESFLYIICNYIHM